MKRKGFLFLVLCVALVFALMPVTAQAQEGVADWDGETITKPAGGGSQNAPYEIGAAEELAWFAAAVNNGQTDIHAVLTANIELNDTDGWEDWGSDAPANLNVWTPIGAQLPNRFIRGSFDGQGYTVKGIYINGGEASYHGLFGRVFQGTVQNVSVTESYIRANNHAGGICGYNDAGSTLENVYFNGIISLSDKYAGGISGSNYGTIEDSHNIGAIGAASGSLGYVGGISGYNNGGTLKNAYNTGAIVGSARVGGISGYNYMGVLENGYNHGSVIGGDYTGGICGFNLGYNSTSTIQYFYNTGSVSGTSVNTGSICGSNSGANAVIQISYPLDSTGYPGVGNTLSGAVSETEDKDAAAFASGEVAWLLGDAFGQTLGSGGDSAPVFRTSVPGNAVFRLAYKLDSETIYATQYYNSGGAILPPIPPKDGFSRWDGLPATMPEEDVEVLAVFRSDSNPGISPAWVVFNKLQPGDVSTTITWNDAGEVTAVKQDGVPLSSPADYELTDNNGTSATLTVKEGYLSGQDAGSLVLAIEFNTGEPAELTIEIVTPEPLDPPAGKRRGTSYLTP